MFMICYEIIYISYKIQLVNITQYFTSESIQALLWKSRRSTNRSFQKTLVWSASCYPITLGLHGLRQAKAVSATFTIYLNM